MSKPSGQISPSIECRACGWRGEGTVAWNARNIREGLDVAAAYVECGGCGSLNLAPTPSREDLDRAYDGLLVQEPGYPSQRKGIRALWRRAFPTPHESPAYPPYAGARLLDVGCGGGGKLAEFQQRGWECFGTDVSSRSLANAAKVLGASNLFAGPLEAAPFARKSFDFVRCDSVVEHLLEPEADIKVMLDFLRPGGLLRIFVPHSRALTVLTLRGGSINSWAPFHLTLFSKPGLRALLARSRAASIVLRQYSPPPWFAMSVDQVLTQRGLRSWQKKVARSVSQVAARPLAVGSAWLGVGEELVADVRGAPDATVRRSEP
jgi:SAM-dependent methyltransferase